MRRASGSKGDGLCEVLKDAGRGVWSGGIRNVVGISKRSSKLGTFVHETEEGCCALMTGKREASRLRRDLCEMKSQSHIDQDGANVPESDLESSIEL